MRALVAEAVKAAATATNGEETVNGTQYDTVTMPFTDPGGATKRVIFLSRTTHLPARRVTYAGNTVVSTDVTLLNRYLAGIPVPQIPTPPPGVTPSTLRTSANSGRGP